LTTIIDETLKDYVDIYEKAHAVRLQFEAETVLWKKTIMDEMRKEKQFVSGKRGGGGDSWGSSEYGRENKGGGFGSWRGDIKDESSWDQNRDDSKSSWWSKEGDRKDQYQAKEQSSWGNQDSHSHGIRKGNLEDDEMSEERAANRARIEKSGSHDSNSGDVCSRDLLRDFQSSIADVAMKESKKLSNNLPPHRPFQSPISKRKR
jgi:hypothetical protein